MERFEEPRKENGTWKEAKDSQGRREAKHKPVFRANGKEGGEGDLNTKGGSGPGLEKRPQDDADSHQRQRTRH